MTFDLLSLLPVLVAGVTAALLVRFVFESYRTSPVRTAPATTAPSGAAARTVPQAALIRRTARAQRAGSLVSA
jgi:hypothetical protein